MPCMFGSYYLSSSGLKMKAFEDRRFSCLIHGWEILKPTRVVRYVEHNELCKIDTNKVSLL